jgi:hypothetical protein
VSATGSPATDTIHIVGFRLGVLVNVALP